VDTLSNPVHTRQFGAAASPRERRHQAIVSSELFGKVRGAIEARRTRPPGRRRSPVVSLLQGRVRCAVCGRPLRIHSNRRGCVFYRYFRCTEIGGLPRCRETHVRVATLEAAVLGIFTEPEHRVGPGRGQPNKTPSEVIGTEAVALTAVHQRVARRSGRF
jgi:hypothetical protein